MHIWDFIAKYWIEFALGGLATLFTAFYRRLTKKFKKLQAVEDSMVLILQYNILAQYERHKQEKTISLEMYNLLKGMFKRYSILDGFPPMGNIEKIIDTWEIVSED